MSDARAKAERSRAKDLRQIPVQDGICTRGAKRKHKSKDWLVIAQNGIFKGQVIQRSPTEEHAREWIEKTQRTLSYGNALKFDIVHKKALRSSTFLQEKAGCS